jgi:hypothetical protein
MAAKTIAATSAIATFTWSARSAALPACVTAAGESTRAVSGQTRVAAPTSSSPEAGHRRLKPSTVPRTTGSETGARSAAARMPSSSVRSAARPAYAAAPGVSTTVASGSTAAAEPTSRSVVLRVRLRRPPCRSLPARPTTGRETGARSATAVMFVSPARSAALRAFRARPGVSTSAASGSIAVVAPISASDINSLEEGATSPEVAPSSNLR